jgi:hypothetical protein
LFFLFLKERGCLSNCQAKGAKTRKERSKYNAL